MRAFILTILTLTTSLLSAQDFQYTETFDTISLAERNIYLSSVARATLYEGSSKNTVSFTLPENTSEWYYAYTTTEGEKGEGFLNLASSLYSTSLIGEASLLDKVSIPKGVNTINVSLIPNYNAQSFINGTEYTYYQNSSIQNSNQGIIQITDNIKGSFALGLSNPSQLNGANVFVEVVAIVSNKTLLNQAVIEEASMFARFAASKFRDRNYKGALALSDSSIAKYELGYAHGIKSAALLQQGKEMAAIKSLKQALTLLANQSDNNAELNSLKGLFKQLKKKEKKSNAQEFLDIINEQRWINILE